MFKDVFGSEGLAHRVTLYLPSTTNVSEALDSETANQVIHRSQRFLSDLFGGATAIAGRGAWVASNGDLVVEEVTLVYASFAELTTETLTQVRDFALALKQELKQESVAVEIDERLLFV